ncbi:alpha/beta fold hydrolase [Nostoc sp.]|uniref:alpha/beta fold hydrolase n=1 Tax=Nostoc sp. TaxID=1180 RepID=UPI002FF7FB2D
MPFVSVRDLQMYYEIRGTGQRLLSISGTGGDLRRLPTIFDSPLEARAAHDTYNRLSQLDIPVYICGGLYDGISPPANLEAMHKQIPGAYLEFFKGGHRFLYQDPQAFKQIIAFLQDKFD